MKELKNGWEKEKSWTRKHDELKKDRIDVTQG